MPLKRTVHWATREFHHFLMARAKMPFAWGSNDCALFAADAVMAMTGTDLAAAFRGKYTDEASAFAAVRSICTSLVPDPSYVTERNLAYVAAHWCAIQAGLPSLEFPLMARRGDLVMVEDSDRLIAGVIHLSGRHAVSVGEAGLKLFSISQVIRAWRV